MHSLIYFIKMVTKIFFLSHFDFQLQVSGSGQILSSAFFNALVSFWLIYFTLILQQQMLQQLLDKQRKKRILLMLQLFKWVFTGLILLNVAVQMLLWGVDKFKSYRCINLNYFFRSTLTFLIFTTMVGLD